MTLSRLVGHMSCFTQLAAYTTEFRDATPSWSTYPRAHQREESGALGVGQQHLDGRGIRRDGVTYAELGRHAGRASQTTVRLPSTTGSSVSAERSIGSRVSWGSSRPANEWKPRSSCGVAELVGCR